jgi:hypothetical protein
MAQSVSNDALWEKLSVVDKKLEKLSVTQKALIPEENQPEIKIDLEDTKDEIITEIKEQAHKLGKHADSNFEANKKNIEILDENIRKVLSTVVRIRKQQRETVEPEKEDKGEYFNFRFFKIRKSPLVIAILGLLVFILTVFCMK